MIAVYARQSVDKADSISIESQIEFCKYEVRGEKFSTYIDKGFSGKNTDRPHFQEMLTDIKDDKISKVIVYKLDRISRSILDFSTMMQVFEKYHVEFVSSTEKFDTSTPMGRAMLNICIVFAQLERETIQKRVTDAYYSRCKKGFYMGGRIPYGYKLEHTVIEGINTSKYVVVPEEAEHIKLIFNMYSEPQNSFGDVVRCLIDKNITNLRVGAWDRARISDMIKNPIYVQADLSIYDFFYDQGSIINNDPSDFIGIYGCYLYTGGADVPRKALCLKGQNVVLAPHEGIVTADTWLKARRKCLNNKQIQRPLKATNTWLAGKVKCGKCGYALTIRKANTKIGRYFICSRHMQTLFCEGVGGLNANEFENIIFNEMKQKLQSFKVLAPHTVNKVNPKIIELSAQIKQVENEIDVLMSKLLDANDVLMAYINKHIVKLDNTRNQLQQEISALNIINVIPDLHGISNYIDIWDELQFDDKRAVVDSLIEVIHATENEIKIKWRI